MSARWRHQVRQGEADADRRDLQTQANARALGPWLDAHQQFADPQLSNEPGDTAAYTGFAANGWWYENGRRVSTGPGDLLGNAVHDFNTRKWERSGGMPHTPATDGIHLHPLTASASTFGATGRFEIRGDFHVRLVVTASLMLPGPSDGAGDDNAIWFGVRTVSGNAAYRAKHTRSTTRDGFAAEVDGVGSFVGYTEQAIDADEGYQLAAIRDGATLRLLAALPDGTTVPLWTGSVPGRCVVEWGARNRVVATPTPAWTATVAEYRHAVGWHNYSARASWARERTLGVISEDWAGDEIDTRLWGVNESTGASVTTGAVASGRGAVMAITEGGHARMRLAAITGDWRARMVARTARADGYEQADGDVVHLLRLDIMPPSESVVMSLAIESTAADGEVTVRPVVLYDDGLGGDPVVLATGDPFSTISPAVVLTVERRGKVLIFTVDDHDDGARPLAYTSTDSAVPTAPLTVRIGVESDAPDAAVSALATSFLVTSPHALRLDSWPTAYYGAGAVGLPIEVAKYPGGSATPQLCHLTLIHAEDRAPFWRMVGVGTDEDGPGDQALPPGAVGDVWADPDGGRIVIPIAGDDGGFAIVDLVQDMIFLRQGSTGREFSGPVSWRHLGLGYTTTDAFDASDAPPDGSALGYAQVEAGDGLAGPLKCWTTAQGVRVVLPHVFGDPFADLMADIDPETDGETEVYRSVLLPPADPAGPSALLILARRRNDLCVAVYLDAEARASAGSESAPGADADAIYTGTDPDPANVGFVAGKIIGPADLATDGVPDIHAIRPTAEAADGRPLFAVCRLKHGASVTQDASPPSAATISTWGIISGGLSVGGGGGDDRSKLAAGGAGVRLTPDACTLAGNARGWLVVATGATFVTGGGEITIAKGDVDVISLVSGRVRSRVYPAVVAPEEFFGLDPRFSAQGLAIAYPPPGVMAGLRLYGGMAGHLTGVFEYDEITVGGGPWDGPHYGGTTIHLQGWGLDDVVGVDVGAVDCFRLALDVRGEQPRLKAVVRALGWIEHPGGPVMPDDELVVTPTWPQDVTIRWRDGTEIVIPDGYTYRSDLETEAQLARIIARLPESVLNGDPKGDTPQRHLMLALASQLVRQQEETAAALSRDTYVQTATGLGLAHLGGSYGAAPPYVGMSDAATRAWVTARIASARVTPLAICDMLEPVLGVRPTITEAYRQFTIHVDRLAIEASAGAPRNFWADPLDPDPLTGGYFDRDFWGGEDPRIVAARRILDVMRAAGVRADLQIEEPTP